MLMEQLIDQAVSLTLILQACLFWY